MKIYWVLAGVWFLVAGCLIVALALVVGEITPWTTLNEAWFGIYVGLVLVVWVLVGPLGLVVAGVMEVRAQLRIPAPVADESGDCRPYLNEWMNATPEQGLELANDAEAAALGREFLDAGFVDEGCICAVRLPNIVIRVFRLERLGVFGSVTLVVGVKRFADIDGFFEGDRELEVSNLPGPRILDSPAGVQRVFMPGVRVPELLAEFERLIPGPLAIKAQPGQFVKLVEWAIWRHEVWRDTRGGLTLEESRRVFIDAQVMDLLKTQEDIVREHLRCVENRHSAWARVGGELVKRYLRDGGVLEHGAQWVKKSARLTCAFEGQSRDEWATGFAKRFGNHPGVGERLEAIARDVRTGIDTARSLAKAHPDWIKEVHTGGHPMTHVVLEIL